MEAKDRIKEIYKERGISQRQFAESVGLKPSSITAIVSGRSKVSRLLANSIELKHGYSAEWILSGKGEKRSIHDNEHRHFNEMLLCSVQSLFDNYDIVLLIGKGILKHIEKEMDEKHRKFVESGERSDKKISGATKAFFELRKELRKEWEHAWYFDETEYASVVFEVYLKFVKGIQEDIQFSNPEIGSVPKRKYTTKIIPAAEKIMEIAAKINKLWGA